MRLITGANTIRYVKQRGRRSIYVSYMCIVHIYIAQQPDTYGADFSHFIGSAVVVVDLLEVPLIADRLDRTYAHLLLVVVVVALLLADEQLVTVARKV